MFIFVFYNSFFLLFFFFFQAEDGIRDVAVTGVQTCALPILSSPRYQTARPRIGEQTSQPCCFGLGHTTAQRRQAIVAAALIIVSGIGSLAQFFDEPGFEQPLDHRIESAWTEADAPVGPLGDVEQDGIAVTIAICQRYKDIKGIPRQRKEVLRLWAFTAK